MKRFRHKTTGWDKAPEALKNYYREQAAAEIDKKLDKYMATGMTKDQALNAIVKDWKAEK